MAIQLEASGFYEWHTNGVSSLGVDSARLDACVDYFRQHSFHGFFGHESFGFKADNLDFLVRTKSATYLWFWDVALKCIDGIYELDGLDEMGIHPKRPGIDFARLPKLKSVVNHWHKKDTGITESTITKYDVWHFKPRDKSYTSLPIPHNVKQLSIYWANPSSLEGMPRLSKLRELDIHCCRNLTDVSALLDVAPNLRRLIMTSSKRVQSEHGIQDHPKLKLAILDGNYLIGEPA